MFSGLTTPTSRTEKELKTPLKPQKKEKAEKKYKPKNIVLKNTS